MHPRPAAVNYGNGWTERFSPFPRVRVSVPGWCGSVLEWGMGDAVAGKGCKVRTVLVVCCLLFLLGSCATRPPEERFIEKRVEPAAPLTDEERVCLEAVAAYSPEIIALARELVLTDSENFGPGTFPDVTEIFAVVSRLLAGYGIVSEVLYALPDAAAGIAAVSVPVGLVAEIAGSKPGRVLQFAAHLDTVPIDPDGGIPQGSIIGERLYGRGSLDMKGGAAAAIAAFLILGSGEVPFDGTVRLLLTPDEESHGQYGARYLAEHYRDAVSADMTLIPEPTRIPPLASPVCILAEKGPLWLELTFMGYSGHGSDPKPLSSAVGKAARFIAGFDSFTFPAGTIPYSVLEMIDQINRRLTIGDLLLAVSGEEQEIPPGTETVPGSRLYDEDPRSLSIVTDSTVSFTGVVSELVPNKIPGEVTVSADFRLMPGIAPEELLEALVRYSADLGYRMVLPEPYPDPLAGNILYASIPQRLPDITVGIITAAEGSWEDPDAPEAELLFAAYEAIYGVAALYALSPGFTDAGHLRAAGISPVYVIGPAGDHAHGPDEYVEIPSILNSARLYLLTALRFLR